MISAISIAEKVKTKVLNRVKLLGSSWVLSDYVTISFFNPNLVINVCFSYLIKHCWDRYQGHRRL